MMAACAIFTVTLYISFKEDRNNPDGTHIIYKTDKLCFTADLNLTESSRKR